MIIYVKLSRTGGKVNCELIVLNNAGDACTLAHTYKLQTVVCMCKLLLRSKDCFTVSCGAND